MSEHTVDRSPIPTISRPVEREAAAERRQAFPYRFPRDTRKLLCEFADIAAPLRATQPLEFAYRP